MDVYVPEDQHALSAFAERMCVVLVGRVHGRSATRSSADSRARPRVVRPHSHRQYVAQRGSAKTRLSESGCPGVVSDHVLGVRHRLCRPSLGIRPPKGRLHGLLPAANFGVPLGLRDLRLEDPIDASRRARHVLGRQRAHHVLGRQCAHTLQRPPCQRDPALGPGLSPRGRRCD